MDRLQAALDIEVRRVVHSWAGLRTFAPDRVPVVGFDPQVAGLFWCAGQGGYGIRDFARAGADRCPRSRNKRNFPRMLPPKGSTRRTSHPSGSRRRQPSIDTVVGSNADRSLAVPVRVSSIGDTFDLGDVYTWRARTTHWVGSSGCCAAQRLDPSPIERKGRDTAVDAGQGRGQQGIAHLRQTAAIHLPPRAQHG